METALILGGSGCVLLFLSIFAVGVLSGRRVRRGRKLGRYPYRAKPNDTSGNSFMGGLH
ncbi:hypothetical protein [Streptomyces cuspidosporus]|uniref:Uncharacterized protein n=1 Tax=Streptomyces cuspidosporus TaxID=66882 RepID=A0ABN3HE95_9ACTN